MAHPTIIHKSQALRTRKYQEANNREKALILAYEWVGTPYKHQACLHGIGVDCIGLIIGIYETLYGRLPIKVPPYTPYWAEETGQELMVDIAKDYLIPIKIGKELPGDVLMYRMFKNGATKHTGIFSKEGYMIHAYSGHNVLETGLVNNRGSKLTYVFRFKD